MMILQIFSSFSDSMILNVSVWEIHMCQVLLESESLHSDCFLATQGKKKFELKSQRLEWVVVSSTAIANPHPILFINQSLIHQT